MNMILTSTSFADFHCIELSTISAIAPIVPKVGIDLIEFKPAPVNDIYL